MAMSCPKNRQVICIIHSSKEQIASWQRIQRGHMFLLLLLSFLQITLIPGLITLKLLKFRGNFIAGVTFSFSLSLIINYLVVFILVALKIYYRNIVFGLLFLEFALLVSLFKTTSWSLSLPDLLRKASSTISHYSIMLDAYAADKDTNKKTVVHAVKLIFPILALYIIVLAAKIFTQNIGTIFFDNDAVGAYNVWAVRLSNNILPSTSYYPFMLPANWSIAYTIQGLPLQFAPKAMMPLFFVFILLMLLDLGRILKKSGFFISVICTFLILEYFFHFYIPEGSMDIAVSYFSFLPIYCLLLSNNADDGEIAIQYALFGALFAAGAAVTKQSGLFILIVYPFLYYAITYRKENNKRINSTRILLFYFICVLVLVIPFYLYRHITILAGTDRSYVSFLVGGMHNGRSIEERFYYAISLISNKLTLVLFICSLLSLTDRTLRWIYILVFIPYTIIWMGLFSYDIRNWAIGFTMLGVAAGNGLGMMIDYLIERIYYPLSVIPVRVFIYCFLIFTIPTLLYQVTITADQIRHKHTEQEKRIVNPELNRQLYEYKDKHGIDKKIYTIYNYIRLLPGFENLFSAASLNFTGSEEEYIKYINAVKSKEIGYILFLSMKNIKRAENIYNDITTKIDDGQYTVIFQNEGYIFIKIEGR